LSNRLWLRNFAAARCWDFGGFAATYLVTSSDLAGSPWEWKGDAVRERCGRAGDEFTVQVPHSRALPHFSGTGPSGGRLFLGYAFGIPHLFLPRSPLHSTGRCGRGPFHRRVLFFSILVCGIAPAQSDGNTSALSFQFFSNQLYGLCRRARAGHVAVRHFRRACHLRSCLLSAKRPVVQLGVQSAPEHPDLCITGARPTYLFCFLY